MKDVLIWAAAIAIFFGVVWLWRVHYVECRAHGFSQLYCFFDK